MGGAERCLVNLAIYLQSKGYQVLLVTLLRLPHPPDALAETVSLKNIPTYSLDFDSVIDLPMAVSRLRRKIREVHAVTAISFLFHANVVCGLAAKWNNELRHIVGVRVADPRKHRALLERVATASAYQYVCVSDSVAQLNVKKYASPASRTSVIPNGIDLQMVSAVQPIDVASLGVASNSRYIVFVGRLHEQKRILEFIEYYKNFNLDVDLMIVGVGPVSAQLKKTIQQLDLTNRVHLLGFQENVLSIVAGAQCLVLPSKWEGMPNVVLEAMALSKPVVAFEVEGVSELVGPCQHQIVPDGDFEAMMHAISKIADVDRTNLRERLGVRNVERIAENFQLETQMQKYLVLIDECNAG